METLHPTGHQKIETIKYFCPFLRKGFCKEANTGRCKFSHESQRSLKIPDTYCFFYLANQCLYGNDCKFIHNEPSELPPQEFESSVPLNDYVEDYPYLYQDEEPICYYSSSLPSTSSGSIPSSIIKDRLMSKSDCFLATNTMRYDDETFVSDDDSAEMVRERDCTTPTLNVLDADQRTTTTVSLANPSPSSETPLAKSVCDRIATSTTKSTSVAHSQDLMGSSNKTSTPSGLSTMVRLGTLRKLNLIQDGCGTSSSSSSVKEKTPEQQPFKSYARVCRGNRVFEDTSLKQLPLCEYAIEGECPNPIGECSYLHGLVCDLCERPCLHPYNPDQQRQHREDCIKHHEEDMEESFNIQRSIDKICGICMEKVMEKQPVAQRRFGILEKCIHIYCLDCIRTWRGTKHFESRTIRACPECRVSSDFVVPSKYWIEDKDDKEKLISGYKENLRLKPCKYFDQGRGQCPFAASCFYKHAYPDGRIAEMDAPRPRRKISAHGTVSAVANYILWNILEGADEEWIYDEWSFREGNESSDDEASW